MAVNIGTLSVFLPNAQDRLQHVDASQFLGFLKTLKPEDHMILRDVFAINDINYAKNEYIEVIIIDLLANPTKRNNLPIAASIYPDLMSCKGADPTSTLMCYIRKLLHNYEEDRKRKDLASLRSLFAKPEGITSITGDGFLKKHITEHEVDKYLAKYGVE